jgi:hypothetical protein
LTRRSTTLILMAALGCAGPPEDPPAATASDSSVTTAGQASRSADSGGAPIGGPRPGERIDTVHIEGEATPQPTRLFTTGAGFPLPFSTYVPENMTAEESRTDSTASVSFIARFGGIRNEDAYVHLYVFPAGTDRQGALALAEGYIASRGVPVSQGLEPLPESEASARMPWATEAWTFRYQRDSGWFFGSLGVGEHRGRFFQLMRHYPGDYGDGFGPRAGLIENGWRWADGTPLR